MAVDDQLAELLVRQADLFATLEEQQNAEIMMIAGTVDDPDSFNETGGKTGALGYYPIIDVNGGVRYFPCMARLKAIALGGANAAVLDVLIAQVGGKLTAVDAATALATAKAGLADEKATLAGQKAAAAQSVVDAGAAIVAAAQPVAGVVDRTSAVEIKAAKTANDLLGTASVWTPAAGDAILGGAFLNAANGAITANADYSYKMFPVQPGARVRLSGRISGAQTALAVFYGSSGEYLGYAVQAVSGPAQVYTEYEMTVPAGAVRLGMSETTGSIALNPMVVKTATYNPAIAADLVVARALADNASANAANAVFSLSRLQAAAESSTTLGSFALATTGALQANASYNTKDFAVTAGEKLRLSATVVGTQTALAVFVSASDGFVSSLNVGLSGSPTVYADYEVTVPAGATKLRMSQQTAYNATNPIAAKRVAFSSTVAPDLYNLIVSFGASQATVAANAADIVGLKDAGSKNTVAVSDFATFAGDGKVTGSFINRADGSIVANSSYEYQLFTVIPGEVLKLSGSVTGGSTALANWFNASGAFLSFSLPAPSGGSTNYVDEIVTVPAGAVKLGMTQRTSASAATPAVPKRGTRLYTLPARVKALEAGLGNSYWAGKTVAWFGNSIPNGDATGTGGVYPAQLAAALGFTLYKETTGGMAFRAGVRSLVSGSDPYGWNGRSWTGLMWSLGMNLAEKQYLIDNWATVGPKLSNDPPATLTAGYIAQGKACSYENRLVANHLGANRKDWYIFDNPFNDRGMADDLTTAGAGSDDRMTYLGTMNFLIRLILEDNPYANIAIVGHYENGKYPTLFAAQKITADLWSIPILALHERLGWSQRPVTVNGSWVVNSTTGLYVWTPGTGSVSMKVLDRILPDGTHPSSDASGVPIRQMTDAILPWMTNLR